MGIRSTGTGDEERIIFSCDYPDCSLKTVRKIVLYSYNKQTGYTSRFVRKPRHPFAYWGKVLAPSFFLHGHTWPDEVVVLCAEHHTGVASGETPSARAERRDSWSNRKDVFD